MGPVDDHLVQLHGSVHPPHVGLISAVHPSTVQHEREVETRQRRRFSSENWCWDKVQRFMEVDWRFEAHELSEVLRCVPLVGLLSLAPLSRPRHLNLLWRSLQHLLLLIWVQAAHANQGMPVLHQLGLKVQFEEVVRKWHRQNVNLPQLCLKVQLLSFSVYKTSEQIENSLLVVFLHWRASSASTSGTSAPSSVFAHRCTLRCRCRATEQTDKLQCCCFHFWFWTSQLNQK